MNLREVLEKASSESLYIQAENIPVARRDAFQNESLFHLPLIAMAILMLAKGRTKPKAEEIGQLIGECFEQALAGFKGSSQGLGWSANLRIRTVKALTFLEVSGFIKKDLSTGKLEATESGKKLIDKVINSDTPLTLSLLKIKRAYRNICKERNIELELQ
ncbi:hypothetical protein [Pseudomonas sp. C9]|uniref:hypothetical protein n=1 Tax=Pseudomonas sp. C9 TaxID=1311337 RepID=UPI0009879426|nr:hypothetical protein [Pseudomonas sp. C9]OOG13733.1 hypothetical protein BMS17_17005 [Pseudomonas sp. C9]